MVHIHPEGSPYCPYCKEGQAELAIHSPRHMFIDCQLANSFWQSVTSWYHQGYPGGNILLTPSFILCPWQNVAPQAHASIGLVHSLGLWTLWAAHWQWVFDAKVMHLVTLHQRF